MNRARFSHLWPGVALALASAVLFGAVTPLAKLLMGNVSSVASAGLLYLGAGLGLLVWRWWQHGLLRFQVRRADWPWCLAAIFFGGVLAPVLMMAGLASSSASTAALLLNLEMLTTLALAWLVFRENVDGWVAAGAAAILAGTVVLSWSGHGLHFSRGSLLIMAACLCWGIDNNLTRKIADMDAVLLAMLKGFVAGSCNLLLALLVGDAVPPLPQGMAIAVLGLFGVGVSLVLYIVALRHLGAARTGAYFALAPFIGSVLAVILLHEVMTVQMLLAAGLFALGLWLHVSERHSHMHEHRTQEHAHLHRHDDGHHDHEHPPGTVLAGQFHSHDHVHGARQHAHVHYPDLHHQHGHR